MCTQIVTVLSAILVIGWFTRKYVPRLARPVFLIDTYTYKPPDRMKVSRENYIRGARMRKVCLCSHTNKSMCRLSRRRHKARLLLFTCAIVT